MAQVTKTWITYLIFWTMLISDLVEGSKNNFDSGEVQSGLLEARDIQLLKS